MESSLQAVMARRDLLRVLVASELRSAIARSRIGWLWWFLDPVLMMLVYWGIVVGVFDRGAERYAPYPAFLFAALITWKHFSTSVTRSLSLLRGRERLIKAIPFPTIVLPLSLVCSGFVYFAFGFVVLVVVTLLFPASRHSGNYLPMLQAPFLMLAQFAITAGVTMVLSCLGVLFEDLKLLAAHALRITFYLSPGLFGLDMVEEKLHELPAPWGDVAYWAYLANPFAILFSGYRDAVVYGNFVPWQWWLILAAQSALALWGGYRIYRFYDRRVIKFL